jgi:hypothetical protein
VRAAGTTAGDWLAFGDGGALRNGLHLGLPLAATISGAALLLILRLWPVSEP